MSQVDPALEQVVARVLATLTSLADPAPQDIAGALMRLPPRPEAFELLLTRAAEAHWPGIPKLRAAVEHLTRLAPPGPLLVALLDNPNPGVVVNALDALGHLRAAVPSELVTKLLYRPEEVVKEHALAFLGRSEPARVLEVLRDMALVPDPSARKRAAFVLGELSEYKGTLRLVLEMLATEADERVLGQLSASILKHARPRTMAAIIGPLTELRAGAEGHRHVALTRALHDVALHFGLAEADVVRIARAWLDRSQVMRASAGYRRGKAERPAARSNVEKLSADLTGSQVRVRPARAAAPPPSRPRTPAFAAALAALPPPPPRPPPVVADPDGPDLPPLKSSRPVAVPPTPRKVSEVDAVKDWLATPQPGGRNSRKTKQLPAVEPQESALMPVLKLGLGFAAFVITVRLVSGPPAPRPSPPPVRRSASAAPRSAPPPSQAATPPPPVREERPPQPAGPGPAPAEDMVLVEGEVVQKITGLVIVKTDTATYEVQTTDPKVPEVGARYSCKGYLLEKPQPGRAIRVIAVR